ncbi:hypothetical protein PFISCL1PPCAC_19173, partial [Pristionchus fissidentatus]
LYKVQTMEDVDRETFELLNLILKIEADEAEIKPDDVDEDVSFPSFTQLNYNLLLSICENRKKVDIKFECDNISDNQWIEFRQKMFSREISLTSLDVLIDESIIDSLLSDLQGIEYTRNRKGMKFFSKEEEKTVIYNESTYEHSYSILFFDGLFLTEFHAFRDEERFNEDRFGLKMKWCENEEEVKKRKENYKIITAIKK